MIDDWKQWAQEFLVLLEEAENAEQEGKSGDTAEQSARRKEWEVELKNRTGLSGPSEVKAKMEVLRGLGVRMDMQDRSQLN